MSWLARSIANTLSLNEEEEDDVNPNQQENSEASSSSSPLSSTPRGVKEDLSELTNTLSRQFWGVASFLAPPPQAENENESVDDKSGQNSDLDESEVVNILGIRNDFAEIGGRFKSGITKLSNNINVSEITKMASNFLQLGSDEETDGLDSVEGTVGLTDEVIAFARDIAKHPETWLDFPLPENEDEEDFDMSDVQQEHALAIERLAPRLTALRIDICPEYMSESSFWKIYFLLIHPTLNKQDAQLLSTPEIIKARVLLADNTQPKEVTVNSSSQHEESLSVPSNEQVSPKVAESEAEKHPVPEFEMEKHQITSSEVEIVDKSIIEVEHITQNKDENVESEASKTWENKDEDESDDWLKEETSEIMSGGVSGTTNIPIEDEEDVSFSDLEEEDEDEDAPVSSKTVNYTSDKDSKEWVQL